MVGAGAYKGGGGARDEFFNRGGDHRDENFRRGGGGRDQKIIIESFFMPKG